jgi:hypothetical protein
MHHFGWSRSRAVDFMWDHTATTQANVDNEIDRYIAQPGQALGYSDGPPRHRVRLREEAQQRLAGRFDFRDFHAGVLGNGAAPSTCWTDSSPAGSRRSMTRDAGLLTRAQPEVTAPGRGTWRLASAPPSSTLRYRSAATCLTFPNSQNDY